MAAQLDVVELPPTTNAGRAAPGFGAAALDAALAVAGVDWPAAGAAGLAWDRVEGQSASAKLVLLGPTAATPDPGGLGGCVVVGFRADPGPEHGALRLVNRPHYEEATVVLRVAEHARRLNIPFRSV